MILSYRLLHVLRSSKFGQAVASNPLGSFLFSKTHRLFQSPHATRSIVTFPVLCSRLILPSFYEEPVTSKYQFFSDELVYAERRPDGEYGLYTKGHVKPGDYLFSFGGNVLSLEQVLALERPDVPFQFEEDQYFENSSGPGVYVNHSCTPNAGLRGDRRVVALKPIHPCDEVLIDYSTAMEEEFWEMLCSCQSPNCRGIIRDFKFLPEYLQQDYLQRRIVSPFIAKKYAPFPV